MRIMKQMNRETLIAYSFYFGGEYGKVYQAIKAQMKIQPHHCDNALTILDPEYPLCFYDLKYPPLVLFYKGDLSLLKKEAYGVVGSRNACPYALKATSSLVRKYPDKVIVSGLAKGIDACAARNAALSIGILGCGIERIYPFCNRELIMETAQKGLLLSEYPSLVKPYGHHFPFRNRLIAALSRRVYIMQSAASSGTMTTVNEALELGKEIRVLPYGLFDPCGEQNNTLIYEGAQPILSEEIAF